MAPGDCHGCKVVGPKWHFQGDLLPIQAFKAQKYRESHSSGLRAEILKK